MIDLSAQIKAKSENMLSNKYFHPEEIKLDLNQFTFQCTFIKKNTPHHIKKLGLYYGPKSTGFTKSTGYYIRAYVKTCYGYTYSNVIYRTTLN